MNPRRVLGPAPAVATRLAADGRSPTVSASRPTLTLYHRDGCHLCEDMDTTLHELVDAERFVLERIDIDLDPDLRQRFHTRVPVLMHGESELCHHFLDLQAVRHVLARYTS